MADAACELPAEVRRHCLEVEVLHVVTQGAETGG